MGAGGRFFVLVVNRNARKVGKKKGEQGWVV